MYNANEKIMRKTVLLLALVSLSSFLFIQCKKDCNSKQLDDKYFTAQELAIVPYNGTEILVYKNSDGDSICFTGQGRISRMDARVSNPDHDQEECAGDKRNAEDNFVTFKSGNTDTIISVGLYFPRPFDDYENLKTINFTCSFTTNHFYGHYGFYGDTIANHYLYLDFYNSDYYFISGYFSALTLINRTYYRVYELKDFNYNGFGNTLYYNVMQGIVGYKESTGTIWYLDRKY
jgi:hypothetical protein